MVVALPMACAEAMALAQSLPIARNEINFYVGDSITVGTYPYWIPYQSDTSTHIVGRAALTTAAGIGSTSTKVGIGSTSTAAALGGTAWTSTYHLSGNPGADVQQIISLEGTWLTAAVAAGTTTYYIEVGVNNAVCCGGSDVAGAQSAALTLISDIHTAAPSAKIAWLNIFSGASEQVPASTDSVVATVNGYISAAVAANSGFSYLLNIHTAQQAYETANNTPNPGVASGILTVDGLHPNNAGMNFMSSTMESQITYTP